MCFRSCLELLYGYGEWATFCALRVCGSKEEVEMMKKVMPETWKCMDGIYHDIAVYLEDHELEYGR